MVGAGNRGIQAFAVPIVKELGDCINLCGVYDLNKKRAALVGEMAGSRIPVYESFEKMIKDAKPEIVIVTTKDSAHDEHVIGALEAGCDVVCEKPLTTDEKKLKAIYEAEKRTERKVTVTFNCRFSPFLSRIKELLAQNIIGEILSVHYEHFLDTVHGADYFRRWHRERKNSGSLLIHKSTHDFDLINWYLDDEPESVSAFGTRRFYGPVREQRGERCLTCPYKSSCEFYFDIKDQEFIRKAYYECEGEDGYFRDKCVFSEEIDIEDSVSLNIKYKKGAVACYSLTAHSPIEGSKMVFAGSEGRMEVTRIKSGKKAENPIIIYNRFGEEIIYREADEARGYSSNLHHLTAENLDGHGGADPLMRAMIFRGAEDDPQGRLADTRAGAMSVGIGIAANKSMVENKTVQIKDFLDFL